MTTPGAKVSLKDRAKAIYDKFIAEIGDGKFSMPQVTNLLQKEIDKHSDDPQFELLADAVWDCMDDQMDNDFKEGV